MRIQSLNQSTYSSRQNNNQPAFKANVHALLELKCSCYKPGKCLDPFAENSLYPKLADELSENILDYVKKIAVQKGLIKEENIFHDICSLLIGPNGEANVVLIDKSVSTPYRQPIFRSISDFDDIRVNSFAIPDYHNNIKGDKETEHLVLNAPKDLICPMLTKLTRNWNISKN